MNLFRSLMLASLPMMFSAPVESGAAAPAAPPPAPKPERIEKNGIVMPKGDTLVGRIWAEADKASANLKRPVTRGELKEIVDKAMPGTNVATFATQFARWSTFHGAAPALKAFRAEQTASRQKEREDEKAAVKAKKDQEKADAKAKKDAEAAEAKRVADEKAANDKAANEAKAKEQADAEAKKAEDKKAVDEKKAQDKAAKKAEADAEKKRKADEKAAKKAADKAVKEQPAG